MIRFGILAVLVSLVASCAPVPVVPVPPPGEGAAPPPTRRLQELLSVAFTIGLLPSFVQRSVIPVNLRRNYDVFGVNMSM